MKEKDAVWNAMRWMEIPLGILSFLKQMMMEPRKIRFPWSSGVLPGMTMLQTQ